MAAPEGGTSEPAVLPTRAEKDVRKYVLAGEELTVATRRHWAVLIAPTVRWLPVLVLGGWLLLLDPDNRFTTVLGLLVALAASAVWAVRVGEWWMRHFIVTNRRVLLTSGLVVRSVTLLPVRRITDLTWKETLFGNLLGYGTFRFESAGKLKALSEITYLPHAEELYRKVSRLLFTSGGDDEGNPESAPAARRDTEPITGLPPRRS
ncbi:PH domain-containing protein [Blastococcus sp. TBT05-19]|uniref:PH domain-containing protein n=1 Tax=Blastococcus sp. TBT05-19 TaxID=2250581 RepID=UPI000DE9F78C|nr:PH domain-containing protein [Blastococcus sp. TBT05-19]RBY91805.1 PH domain-containing protein [Blastococcus sp. TBT05-19]